MKAETLVTFEFRDGWAGVDQDAFYAFLVTDELVGFMMKEGYFNEDRTMLTFPLKNGQDSKQFYEEILGQII